VTGQGHRIGAPDETNFEFGLDCILDHAGSLIEKGGKGGKVTSRKQAIAIGLSEARKKGAKVPAKKAS